MTDAGPATAEIESYRGLFPATQHKIWLNHASMATLPTPVVEAMISHLRAHSMGELGQGTGTRIAEKVRKQAAEFLNCDSGEVAFTKNVPDGLNIIARGIDWKPGDNVVIADQEFPANVYPWKNLATLGVRTVQVASEAGRVPLEGVVAAIDGRTKVVSLSWVEFSTGYRNDLQEIAAECKRRGVLFCVDGIQGVGALQLDVKAAGVDVMVTSSHKWLLGPPGVGWMYIRRPWLEKISVTFMGQSSVCRGPSASYLDYDLPIWPDARRFEPGILNTPGLVGLGAVLAMFAEVGMDRVQSRIKFLTDLVADGVSSRGYRIATTRDGDHWSGAVSIRHPEVRATEVYERLTAAGIVVSLRDDVVRISPHFYNNEEDIERLITTLPLS